MTYLMQAAEDRRQTCLLQRVQLEHLPESDQQEP